MSKYKKIKKRNIYSKSKSKQKWKKITINILFVLLLVAVGFFLTKFISENFNKQNSSNSQSSSNLDNNSSSSENLPSESSSSSSVTEQKTEQIMNMPLDVALNVEKAKTFISNAKSKGYSSIVVELKDNTGKIYYDSKIQQAIQYKAINSNKIDIENLISEIKNQDMQAIAKVNAFNDHTAAHYRNDNSYSYRNGTWYDGDPNGAGRRWLNPYKDKARNYISDIGVEISEKGFNSIIFADVQFPNTLGYETPNQTLKKQEILNKFVNELETKITKSNVIIGFDSNSYFDVNTEKYGGNPKNIVAKNICAFINTSDLNNILINGNKINVQQDANLLIGKLKEIIPNVKIYGNVSGNYFDEYVEACIALKLKGVIT